MDLLRLVRVARAAPRQRTKGRTAWAAVQRRKLRRLGVRNDLEAADSTNKGYDSLNNYVVDYIPRRCGFVQR
uniref:Uncharacterized protein n=1 Tax=Hyaloperonospora arabidopsidis (strain Emoy2) TaxID=559515 RepID=M4BU14_HYAAE